tara:strand:- start:141 stop:788 length:648 start_codon:yes stop_codon:yes gene_type:complete
MDRRKALRTIGFGTTAITVTPAVVGMLQSCQSQTTTYTATLFTKDQFAVLSQVMELIIPKTDIPGAVELKLPEFLDGFMSVVFNKQAQQKVVDGLDHFIAVALEDSGKSSTGRLNAADCDAQLAKYLKADQQQQKAWKQEIKDYQKAVKEDSTLNAPATAKAHAFAMQLRSLTINAFKTNEYIGENVLVYAPIPGEQKGCVDLMEATGGKAWSPL